MTPGALRVEIVPGIEALEALEPEWNRLWSARSRRSIFTGFPWRRAAAGRVEGEVQVVVASRGSRVVGILPLLLKGGTLRFLGARWADYSDVICDPEGSGETVATIFESLLSSRLGWNACLLENLPEDAALLESVEHLPEGIRRSIHVTPGAVCPTLLLGEDRDATLDALLGKKSLRQRESRLGKLGTLEFAHLTDRESARRHLAILFDQHAARWAMAGEPSPFRQPDTRAFYEDLVDRLDPRSELRFSVLTLDRRPLACHFGFETGGNFTFYKPTFDVDFWDYSPGDVLLKNLLVYVRERDIVEFDFTRGDEAYKMRFANHARRNRTLRLYRPGLGGTAARRIHLAGEELRDVKDAAPVASALSLRRRAGDLLAAARRRGIPRFFAEECRGLVRARLHARDEIVVRRIDRLPATEGPPEAAVEAATLTALALLAVEHVRPLDPEKLARARSRLKGRDLAWIARSDRTGAIEIFWSGTREEIACPLDEEPGARLALSSPHAVVYDRWPVRGALDPAEEAAALREIARRESSEAILVAVPVSLEGTRLAGARATHRIGATRRLGRLRRTWVDEVREP